MIYWYASLYRPPSFCTMPKTTLTELDRTFPGELFAARAYPEKLSDDVVRDFQLKLVEVDK